MKRHLVSIGIAFCLVNTTACSYWRHWHQPPAAASLVAHQAAPAKPLPAGQVNMALIKQGYAVGIQRSQYVYCRSEIQTGSRLPSRVCNTEAEMLQQASDTRAFLDSVNQRTLRCDRSGCFRR